MGNGPMGMGRKRKRRGNDIYRSLAIMTIPDKLFKRLRGEFDELESSSSSRNSIDTRITASTAH